MTVLVFKIDTLIYLRISKEFVRENTNYFREIFQSINSEKILTMSNFRFAVYVGYSNALDRALRHLI